MAVTALGLSVFRIPYLHTMALGGRLRHCLAGWDLIGVSDWVHNVISVGYRIPFKFVPKQFRIPKNPVVSGAAHDVLVAEATDLKAKGAVVPVTPVEGEYISSYFAVPKLRSPGKFRPILNLKRFNYSVKKYKFEMESLKQVRDWIKPDAFCVGIDLKDAYPHIPIHHDF